MIFNRKYLISITLIVVATFTCGKCSLCLAGVRLPVIISDGMVLQRAEPVRIWGWADPGQQVNIAIQKQSVMTTTDASGNWEVRLAPLTPGGPFRMMVNEVVVEDILVGDVWLCSGQSNMETTVSRVFDMFGDEILGYTNPMIRHIKIPTAYDFDGPQTDVRPAHWMGLNQDNVMSFSALCYFFAKDIYAKTGIPVGIINSSVGGSPAQAWIEANRIQRFPGYYNDYLMSKSKEYRRVAQEFGQTACSVWYQTLYRQDPGRSATPLWWGDKMDDHDWTSVDLLNQRWGNDGVSPINGSFWFRKSIDVPANLAGEDAVLRLGCVVDADSAFVNGVFVGTTSYQYPPRIYPIPRGLLRAGENQITVRVVSQGGRPHFVDDKPYKIVFKSGEISLEGTWKMRIGAVMPPMVGGVSFQNKPSGLYNGMIAPLSRFAVKGVVWYQGESNTGHYNDYYDLVETLITSWREERQKPELPFFIIQLPNFMAVDSRPSESGWAELRDSQLQLSRKISNTGLVVTIDVGEWNDIHPLDKKTVGQRLALQARKVAYGEKIVADGPIFDSAARRGDKFVISFMEGTDDLEASTELKGFAIAGKDGWFRWAKAITEGNKVVVWSDEVADPVEVRYAWGNNPEGANLRNKLGIPASPFRGKK